MAQPGDFAYQVKQSSDIVRVVGEYVRLKKGSGPRFTGLCPFHQEKTPSFSVNSAHQFYHCFGCGASGDVFKFVMEMERLTFPEAVRMLAERAGMPIPRQRGPEADAEARLRGALYDMHEAAAKFFQKSLQSSEASGARQYLERRGITPEVAAEFGLGYAPASGSGLARQFERDYSPETLDASGLVLKRDTGGYFDRFRGRLMFPIANESGKVIAFGGRALRDADQPKYLNSPETAIYRKSRVLFNYHRARDTMRREERVVLVEGYMDAIAVHSAGVRNVVASCGTALTAQQVKALAPMLKRVIVNYDADSPGVEATVKSISTILEENLKVEVLSIPEGKDPDDFIRSAGSAAYQGLLEQAVSFFDFLIERTKAKHDLATASGRAEAGRYLLQYVNKLPDPLERSEMAKYLADRLGLERQVVAREVASAAADRRSVNLPVPAGVLRCEKELLRLLIENHEARPALLHELEATGLWTGWLTQPAFLAMRNMQLEPGETLDLQALMDRLEAEHRNRLAAVLNDDTVESITAERAWQYLEELRTLQVLTRLRKEKCVEMAALGPEQNQTPETALQRARIALEIRQIDAQLNAAHLLPEGFTA